MDFLFNYGISQEDALTECKALDLTSGDSLLCIASAGEIPLNIAALKSVKITAVDISPYQLRLCRIKQAAALNCESVVAASFLGYMEMEADKREMIFREVISSLLSEEDLKYWNANIEAVRIGVINCGRFEQFMRKVTGIGRLIVGKKNLYNLFDCSTIEEQREVFDRTINGIIVKGIFRIAFHPWIYKNRGIDPAGLTHSGARNIGEFFFRRFRNFCCNTLSRNNYYLQFTFFNRVLFPEALPEFLQPRLHEKFSVNVKNIEYRETTIEKTIEAARPGDYNKIHISNIGDWMSKDSMAGLFRLIRNGTSPGAKIIMRYIHLGHKIPDDVPELQSNAALGNELVLEDRYPFYSVVPIIRI